MDDRFKFRVWLKNSQRMILDVHKDDCFNSFIENVNDRYVLMQCTGLKDKNGKLIYEGDIVNYAWQYINGKAGDIRVGKVIFQENTGVFAIWGDNELYGQTKRLLFEKLLMQNIEIIGNIHQDKDLLNA